VHKGFTYSRAANPTVSALEAALGALEDTPPAVCFSTGMAAISTLFLAILKSAITSSFPTWSTAARCGCSSSAGELRRGSFVRRYFESKRGRAGHPAGHKLVFIETPANPTLKLTDIAAIAKIAHALA